MSLIRWTLQERSKSSLKFLDISIVTEYNVIYFSDWKKAYMVNPNIHASGMKGCEMVCQFVVLWQERRIPDFSCLRMWVVWYMWMIICFGYVQNLILKKPWSLSRSMDPVTIGNTEREIQCLSYYLLTSRHSITAVFSFIKLDWF